MRRVTFIRGYRMYQPGETAGFSDAEASRLIPAFGFDADDPDAAARKAAQAEEKANAKADADAKAEEDADAKAKADADTKAKENKAKG